MPPPDGTPAREATEDYAERLRRRAVGGLRFDAHERRRILAMLRDVEAELIARIRSADVTGVNRTAAQKRRLAVLVRDARSRIRVMMRAIRDASRLGLEEYASAEAVWTRAALVEAVASAGIQTAVRVAPAEVLRALVGETLMVGRPLEEWWSRQADSLVGDFTREMRLAQAQGETVDQMVRRVRGSRAGGFRDGIMQTTRRQASALVRTSVNAIGNQARAAVYAANADLITAQVHSSVLDSRTTLQCASRDGLAWDNDKKPIGHRVPYQVPPIHVNCRSVLLPRIGTATRIPGQRASADGPVPASRTFETWLKGKSVAEQNEILGAGRAGLWREQKLTLSQLLDFKGEPLSLAELAARYPN